MWLKNRGKPDAAKIIRPYNFDDDKQVLSGGRVL
jgi:hypothetical protein